MKVIFLDIDGVLNDVNTKERAPTGVVGINPKMVEELCRIVSTTGAVIVLTSTWKRCWNVQKELCSRDGRYLWDMLSECGLSIFDKTVDHMFDRGKGISEWLSGRTDIEAWVVIDDDIFEDYEQYGVLSNLIKTNYYTGGLTEKHARKAIALLNREEDEYGNGIR